MEVNKQELLNNGWKVIGTKGSLEYLGKKGEFGEIQFLPLQGGKSISNIQSVSKEVLVLLVNFVDEME